MKQLGPFDLHKMLAGFEDKSAVAIATFAYCEGPGHEPIIFQGRTEVKFPTALPSLANLRLTEMDRANWYRPEGIRTSVGDFIKLGQVTALTAA